MSIALVNPRLFSREQSAATFSSPTCVYQLSPETKTSTGEDEKQQHQQQQQKWRFKGDEIGACLFDAIDPERYVYFARNAVLEMHDRRKTTSSSSSNDDDIQQTKSKIFSRTFSDDVSALALDAKCHRMAVADDSGDVNVVSLVMREDGGEEFPLMQTFKNAHMMPRAGAPRQ